MRSLLIGAGVAGALLDVLLHVLQLYDLPFLKYLQGKTAWITLFSAVLIALSLFAQFNAGTLCMDIFIGGLAVVSLITGKEFDH